MQPKVTLEYKWFDQWVGLYIDARTLPWTFYYCPWPGFCYKVEFL